MKKLVVITGAGSGFGYEMAKIFSENGHPLLLLDKRSDLDSLNVFENTIVRQVDVTKYDEFEKAVRDAEEIYGKTDLLLNNAGMMLLGNINNQDRSEWSKMFDVNVLAVLNGMQIVLDDMIERKGGTIINTSSIAGFKTFGNHSAYGATKYGVHCLTETTREEVSAHNVRVLLVSPGAAETELLSHTTSQDIKDGYNQWKQAMGGVSLDPKHVASSVYFMYNMPQEVSVREITIAATKQDA